jgi:tetratricopeptide (TPR) repeat protein
MIQQRYAEALELRTEARDTFAALGEPRAVAEAWYHIGVIHRQAERFKEAEQTHRQSLAIAVQQKYLALEGGNLSALGNLYDALGRLEEAVIFYQQAADVFIKLQNLMNEGISRYNLADTLIKLQRYDEARRELHRAIECKKRFSHAAELWKTWDILHDLEQATGHPQAAAQARQQAIESYLAYRRADGASQSNVAELYALVSQAIQQGAMTEAANYLAELSSANAPPEFMLLLAKLQAILRGDRDPALADDPNLDYDDAAELHLLLESLAL